MGLRQRGYLEEANLKRDQSVRSEATKFQSAFQKWFKANPKGLQSSNDGAFYVKANKFWKHPRAKNLLVVFAPRGKGIAGGAGMLKSMEVVVFKTLIAPFDSRHLDTRLSVNIVTHELAHILDKGFQKGKRSSDQYDKGNVSDYFNTPSEWNAYWHEGAGQVERILANPMVRENKGALDMFFGDGSFPSFNSRVHHFWNKDFLKNMNSKVRRKFTKRLFQLWNGMKVKWKL